MQVGVAWNSSGKVSANELSFVSTSGRCACVCSLLSFMRLIAFGWDISAVHTHTIHTLLAMSCALCVYAKYVCINCKKYCLSFIQCALLRLSDWIICILNSSIDNAMCLLCLWMVCMCVCAVQVFIVWVCNVHCIGCDAFYNIFSMFFLLLFLRFANIRFVLTPSILNGAANFEIW